MDSNPVPYILSLAIKYFNFSENYFFMSLNSIAIIVRSISERLFANYYLKFKKPVRPTKVFTNPKVAEEWLGQFVKIEEPLNYDL